MSDRNPSLIERKKVSQSVERKLLIGMIVSDQFIREVQTLLRPELIQTKYAATIIKWCQEYFEKYDKAPGIHIEHIYTQNSVDLDDNTAHYIEELLESISEEYERSEKFNVDYLLNELEKELQARALELLAADIKTYALSDVERAHELVLNYRPVERPRAQGIDPFADEAAIERALTTQREPVFSLPGALGDMINPQLVRQACIAIMAPSKRGKSMYLRDWALRAWYDKCNVAYFVLGDDSEEEAIALLHSNIAGLPLASHARSGPVTVAVLDCKLNQDGSCQSEDCMSPISMYNTSDRKMTYREAKEAGYVPCARCRNIQGTVFYDQKIYNPLTVAQAIEYGKRWTNRTQGARFKLSAHYNDSLSISQMDTILYQWSIYENFVPDVIIGDYIDIAKAEESSGREFRHQENAKWKGFRKLTQKWNACGIIATQADAEALEKETLTLKNFSENVRKYDHVTAMYTLNQTDDEKALHLMRVGELLVRHGEFDRRRFVTVIENRHIGRAHVGSYF